MSRSRLALSVSAAALLPLVVTLAPAAAAEEKAPRIYKCIGFDEPLSRSPIQVPRGRVLPLRAKLAGPDDSWGDDKTIQRPPVVRLALAPDGQPEVDKSEEIEVRDYGKGRSFVFDPEAHWKFDLGTKSLPNEGKYRVTLLTGDQKEYTVNPTCTLEFILHGEK